MRNNEVEEGEAFFLHDDDDDDDDDENIDPDRDFSYIDHKLENLLGHYKKDFMGGYTAKCLGPVHGGYGSFLPMYERSPPLSAHQRSQSHVNLKSPPNLPSEASNHLSKIPTVAACTSVSAKSVPVPNDQAGKHLVGSEISFVNNQSRPKNSAECVSTHRNNQSNPKNPAESVSTPLQQPKKPITDHSERNSLKFKVKMASENVLSRNISAIYSGLGLDMSPTLSPEGTPLQFDRASPGFQELKLESPSFIVEIMTSIPLPNDALISPLHDDLICLMKKEKTSETSLPGIAQSVPLNMIHDNAHIEGKKEVSDEIKLKLKDTRKEKNPKQKEASKEMKPKQNIRKPNPENLVKEDDEFPAQLSDFGVIRREEIGTSVGKKIVSNTAIHAMMEDGNSSKITSKFEKDKKKTAIPKVEAGVDKGNVFGRREDDAIKFPKQHNVVKDIVKGEGFSLGCPKEADGYRKGSVKPKLIVKDKEVSLVCGEDVKDNNKHVDIHQEIKHHDSEYFESSKQKSYSKAMPHLKTSPSLDEASSSLAKKKLKNSQTGNVSSTDLFRESVVSSSRPNGEGVARRNVPSNCKKTDIDVPKEMRKESKVAVIKHCSKKGKEVSSREIGVGLSEKDIQSSAGKMKEQLSSNKMGFAHSGPSLEGDMADGNCFRESVPVGEFVPPVNDSLVPLEMDDWVQCEKCQKWRLLPFGMNPDSLPKEWICSMLTWLPGMNKCSVSEDETNQKLHALYLPTALAPTLQTQNNNQGLADGTAGVKASSGAQNAGAVRQNGAHDLYRPIKKNPLHSVGITIPKNPKKFQLETAGASKLGDGRPSKIPKKRVAESELSRDSKKVKNVHQQSMENSTVVGLLPPRAKGGSRNEVPDAFRTSQEFGQGSSERLPLKIKKRGRGVMTAVDDEINDVSEKTIKMKDQGKSGEAAEPFGYGQRPLSNLVPSKNNGTEPRKERKTSTSNIETRESSEGNGHHRTKGTVRKHSLGPADDNSQHKGSRVGGNTPEPYQTDRISRKRADGRKSSEGLSDDATTSSSSKVSIKVKAKAREVKCSPVGSISSSPLKVCRSNPHTGRNKVVVSYGEHEESSSRKRQKFRSEGVSTSHEFAQHNEEIKDRKSNLSGAYDMTSDAPKKVSSVRHYNTHGVDSESRLEDFERHDGKLDRSPENHMPNGSHFDETLTNRQKLCPAEMGGEKELSMFAERVSDSEKGGGSNSVRVGNRDGKLSRQVLDGDVNLRHPYHTPHAPEDVDGSSSKQKDGFHTDARTALKEAKDLKHSANRLKTAGSGLSTGIFFQAALKFLHGASLLVPETTENGRIGEMVSTEVYRSTAKLCEYCAHEYEKCNDMASAALAYKCMEVAYMRVVYDNDVAASRDRVEVQMAVRAAPQVESPSSSASDIDNLNNQVAMDSIRDGHCVMDHRNHVISARNRPNFLRLLSFTHDINLAMEASKRSQSAFGVANPILSHAGNEEGISSIKRVLDFSFHDVDGLLHLVRLAMEALNN